MVKTRAAKKASTTTGMATTTPTTDDGREVVMLTSFIGLPLAEHFAKLVLSNALDGGLEGLRKVLKLGEKPQELAAEMNSAQGRYKFIVPSNAEATVSSTFFNPLLRKWGGKLAPLLREELDRLQRVQKKTLVEKDEKNQMLSVENDDLKEEIDRLTAELESMNQSRTTAQSSTDETTHNNETSNGNTETTQPSDDDDDDKIFDDDEIENMNREWNDPPPTLDRQQRVQSATTQVLQQQQQVEAERNNVGSTNFLSDHQFEMGMEQWSNGMDSLETSFSNGFDSLETSYSNAFGEWKNVMVGRSNVAPTSQAPTTSRSNTNTPRRPRRGGRSRSRPPTPNLM